MKLLFIGLRTYFEAYLEFLDIDQGHILTCYTDVNAGIREAQRTSYDICVISGPRLAENAILVEMVRLFRQETGDLCIGQIISERCEATEYACISVGAMFCIQPDSDLRLNLRRIEGILKNGIQDHPSWATTDECEFVAYGILRVYPSQGYALVDENRVELTVTESRILKLLASRRSMIVDRDTLISVAYEETVDVDYRTVDSHIKRLRKKLRNKDSQQYKLIETVYGLGYRLIEEPTLAGKSVRNNTHIRSASQTM